MTRITRGFNSTPVTMIEPDLPPAIPLEAFQALAREGVPLVGQLDPVIELLARGTCHVRLPYAPLMLRPGGTISGPAMMALADITLYGAVLSCIGRVELAVTTDLAIRFLRRPGPADLVAQGRILKLGRRLVVGEIVIMSADGQGTVAHATGSYAIPDPT